MSTPIGFMQGRLSPIVDGKIQSFPWSNWENEIKEAAHNGFQLMEWTLDQENLYQNPFMSKEGQEKIKKLKQEFEFEIPSLTGDCFMQSPFYKAESKSEENKLKQDFENIIISGHKLNVRFVCMPLVDNGRLENSDQEKKLLDFLMSKDQFLQDHNIKIVFESDYIPKDLQTFIAQLPSHSFGINYDIGNSAALGFTPDEEFKLYGNRILNIHIKDRLFKGTTVPLGTGHADFNNVFINLNKVAYRGHYILQTARAEDNNHIDLLKKFRDFSSQLIKEHRL